MKFKRMREIKKKELKAHGKNACELKAKVSEAISEGFIDYAAMLRKRGLRRGYAV